MYDYQFAAAIEKDLKKIRSQQLKKKVMEAIEAVRENPACGNPKVGDLVGLFTVKVSAAGVSYRLGYFVDEDEELVIFILFDTRERFYGRAKRLFFQCSQQ